MVSVRQLQELSQKLQECADGTLLIAIDQEGGAVSRFPTVLGFPQTHRAELLGNNKKQLQTDAMQTAEMLKEVGINLNLAPVVDLNNNPDCPIIGKFGRSFGKDHNKVAECAKIWIQAHRECGIACCLKHLPGHGSAESDSHLGFTDISNSWQEEELLPYRQLIKEKYADAIMVGHLYHKAFDPQHPLSLSERALTPLARGQLNFNGPLLSDDMQMRAISHYYGMEEAVVQAIRAGIDLLIIGNNLLHDPKIVEKIHRTILRALEAGTLSEKQINTAWQRVNALRPYNSPL